MKRDDRVRVAHDCIDARTGEVWIFKGDLGYVVDTFTANNGVFYINVALDDGRRIAFKPENIALATSARII